MSSACAAAQIGAAAHMNAGPASAARLRTHPDRAVSKRATQMLDELNPLAKAKKDAIAKLLFGMNKQQLAGVAKENSLDMKSHYDLRNVGHYRMILGQALRNLILNKKQEILIGGVTVADLDQKVKWPEGYIEEPKGTHDQPIRKGKASTSRIKA